MPRLPRLIVITFLESIAAVLAERGVYFVTHQRLAFSDSQNLWLAVCLAGPYIVGAVTSHNLARRFGEKRILIATIAVQAVTHLAMILWPHGAVLSAGLGVIGALNGAKWPVIESYVSAGRDPRDTSRAIGIFNVSWSLAVPIALSITGPMIALTLTPALESYPLAGLFGVAIAANLTSMVLSRPLGDSPTHLALDHPSRAPVELTDRYRALLKSSRWSMLGSYALLFLATPLLPSVFTHLHVADAIAPALSGINDWVRTGTFVLMQLTAFWHGRSSLVVAVVLGMPVGFFLLMFGTTLPMVIAGMVLFGVVSGIAYFSSLYYAMVIKNASVDAGGVHEGLIGVGFLLGPVVGLLAQWLAMGPMHDMRNAALPSTIVCVSPIIAVCAIGGLWPIWKRNNQQAQ